MPSHRHPVLSLVLLSFVAAAAGCADDSYDSIAQELVGECTTTSQCKQMYDGATDCNNSAGGVCYCGNAICADAVAPGTGGTSSSAGGEQPTECSSKAECVGLYPDLNVLKCNTNGWCRCQNGATTTRCENLADAADPGPGTGGTNGGEHVVPGLIEAEDFDRYQDSDSTHFGDCGSGPVDQQTTSDQGGGCAIGWTVAGEWLEYDIDAGNGGDFDVVLRLASASGNRRVQLLVDGQSVGTVTAPSGGWQHWANRVVSNVHLGAGSHVLRVRFVDGNVNFNHLNVTTASDGSGNTGGTGGTGGTSTGGTGGASDPGNPASYTGQTHWNATTGTLTFTTDGKLPNTHHGWDVPSKVTRIIIGAGVTVNGRFDVTHTMTIEGEDRQSSVLFGTNQQGYNKANDGCGLCKSAVLGEGNITVTVKNLTSLNPYGFHFTGKKGAKFVVDSVDALDRRGGHGNNSDGVSAADGTIVRNCYFESGDDIIKVYADIEVINTTIKMVTNTVPIQFGWGSYGSGARGVFRNLTVTGNSGRGAADNAMISARQGTYDKTIEIDGLKLDNPNAVVMIFRDAKGHADITIKNAEIDVKAFRGDQWSMDVDPRVCGTVYSNGKGAPNHFDCR